MTWADLFERADSHRTDPETIRERLDARRGGETTDGEADDA
ncbi:hypothetical protein [Halorussus halobius]|nr:hypothetical protein [Halorussus halobius]